LLTVTGVQTCALPICFGGQAGVDAFTELRWITVQTTPRHYPF